MAIAIAAIRSAIIGVMEGSFGTISPASGVFRYGAFEGQPDVAKLTKLRQTSEATHWFDVVLSPTRTHAGSNMSTLSSRRIATMLVEIPIWTGLLTEAQEDARSCLLASIASDGEDAAQSLGYPNGMLTAPDDTATGIVGGCLLGPDSDGKGVPLWAKSDEDWGKRWFKSVITGSIIIEIASLAA